VETHALSGIHLTISRGEYVAMSGPSGCGKSTLLSILAPRHATGGKYLLTVSRSKTSASATGRAFATRRSGSIFQSFNLIGD